MPPVRPAGNAAPRRSDLRGFFHLISENSSSAHRTSLVITDGHYTAGAPLDRVNLPENVTLVIMLVSEKNGDGYEGYALRRREMLDVCPQAAVVPHSQEDFSFLIPASPAPRGLNQKVSQK